jgi:hypothetical protein
MMEHNPTSGRAPEGYEELSAYLDTPEARRRALGVRSVTIARWDSRSATRLSESHQWRVDVLLQAARELEMIVGSGPLVKELLLRPQPMFDGRVPARDIVTYGQGFAEMYVDAVRAVHDVKLAHLRKLIADRELWDSLEEGLSDAARARRARVIAAIKAYRAEHGKLSLLG